MLGYSAGAPKPGEKLHEDLIKGDEISVPSHHSKITISAADHERHYEIDNHIGELALLLDGSDSAIIKNNAGGCARVFTINRLPC